MWNRCQDVIHENKLQQMMPECVSGNAMSFMKTSYLKTLNHVDVIHENKLQQMMPECVTGNAMSLMKTSYLKTFNHVVEVS
jgi:hypothetical protein